ncbi:MAG: Ig-like domain-containing protein [Oscillospiraceae bacterium]|nr:Ig-like domain-containing protein [Oscillospiraceae bacterium]
MRATCVDNGAYTDYEVRVYPTASAVDGSFESEAIYKAEEYTYYVDIRELTKDNTIIGTANFDVLPADSGVTELVKISASGGAVVTVDEDDPNMCSISIPWDSKKGLAKAGTFTITATATDGSGKKCSIKIITGIYSDAVDGEVLPEYELKGGKSLTLPTKTLAVYTDANGKSFSPTKGGVTWKLVNPADSAYLSVSSSGKLTAKSSVTGSHKVYLVAYSKDLGDVLSSTTINVIPANLGKLNISDSLDDPRTIAGSTLTLNVGESLKIYGAELDEDSYLPMIYDGTLSFKSSNTKVAKVDADGTISIVGAGTATITVTDQNKRSATMKVKGVIPAQTVSVYDSAGNLIRNSLGESNTASICAGKSISFKVVTEPAKVTAKAQWSVVDGVGTVKSGKYTAPKSVPEAASATLEVQVGDIVLPINVEVTVPVTGVSINHGLELVKGQPVIDLRYGNTVELSAVCCPVVSVQDVKWTSSSQSIATVEDGTVTFLKPGTVTIKATATDGSGKSASLKIKAIQSPESIELNYGSSTSVIAGKKLTFKASSFLPVNTTEKGITWVLDDYSYASISSSGVLTTKKLTVPTVVYVSALRKSDGEFLAGCEVTIYPAVKTIKLLHELTVKKSVAQLDLSKGNGVELQLLISPNYEAEVEWSISEGVDVSFDYSGHYANISFYEPGTVTVKARLLDGSGKSVSLKINAFGELRMD